MERAIQFRNLQLKVAAIKSFKYEPQPPSRHDFHLKSLAFTSLLDYQEYRLQKSQQFTLSLSHYIQRQYRMGLFAFKKNHLMLVMQRSIASQIKNRYRSRVFDQWRAVLQQRLLTKGNEKEANSESDLEPNARMSQELLQDFKFDNQQVGFNDTAGTKFSELDFNNDDP